MVSAGKEGVGTNKRYKRPRASTLRRFNKTVKVASPRMGWRSKVARAWDADAKQWIDLKIRDGVA